LGSEVAPGTSSDGNGDGVIDVDDLELWQDHFGLLNDYNVLEALGQSHVQALDALYSAGDFSALFYPSEETMKKPRWRR
jgi:hypothetical protein